MRDWTPHLTQLTEAKRQRYTAAGWWADHRLCDYLDAAARLTPDKTAVVDSRGRWTYRELEACVDNVARGLIAMGVDAGDVVSFQLPNWREVPVLVTACTRIGAVYNGIAPIFRERDMEVMLRLARPKVLVVPDAFRGFDHAAMGAELKASIPSLEHVLVIGDRIPAGCEAFSQFSAADWRRSVSDSALEARLPDADSVTQIAFTSGTTGEPKGILHTHNTVLHASRFFIDRFQLGAADVFHMASTLGHQTGHLFGTQLFLMAGGTAVYQEAWNAEEFVELVERERITMSNGAIPFLNDFLRAPNFGRHDNSSLRYFGCFGAGLPRPLARLAAEKLAGCKIFGGWGMTETGLAVTNLPSDSLDLVCDTDGVPGPGTEIRIIDPERSAEVPTGVEGELVTRGPLRHLGFVQVDLAPLYFLNDDWYLTGDRGLIRDDGYFVMTSRSKDIIIRGGENIPVLEVENLLLEHPAVLSVAVVAVPDERLGEKACACVVPKPGEGFDLDAMRSWLGEKRLTKHYWPEILEVFDAFPTTASGKVQKFKLRELMAARYGTPAAAT